MTTDHTERASKPAPAAPPTTDLLEAERPRIVDQRVAAMTEEMARELATQRSAAKAGLAAVKQLDAMLMAERETVARLERELEHARLPFWRRVGRRAPS